jgi:hypothetical protein
MKTCSAQTPEIMRQVFRFLVAHRTPEGDGPGELCVTSKELLGFAEHMRKLFAGMELEASKTRIMATITLLQLEAGDYVAVSLFRHRSISSIRYTCVIVVTIFLRVIGKCNIS